MKTIAPYYSDNQVTLYHGDSENILSTLDSASVDTVVTDPPFGINYQNNYTSQMHDKIANDKAAFSYYKFGKECCRLLKDNGALFSYTCWSEYSKHIEEIHKAGFETKEPLIVQKRPSGKTDLYGAFQSNSDWILFATKGRFKFRETCLIKNKRAGTVPNKGRNPVPIYKTRFPSCWFGSEYPYSTENPATEPEYRHPTKKTVKLMQWLILLTTDDDGIVIDPFSGSGTTLIASTMSGRKSIGIEIEERNCETTVLRLERLLKG